MKSFNDAVSATYIGVQLSYDIQELINDYTSSSRGDPKLIEITTESGTGVIDFEITYNSLSGGCYIKKPSGSTAISYKPVSDTDDFEIGIIDRDDAYGIIVFKNSNKITKLVADGVTIQTIENIVSPIIGMLHEIGISMKDVYYGETTDDFLQ